MAVEKFTPGMLALALSGSVAESVPARVEGSIDLLKYLSTVDPTAEDVANWAEIAKARSRKPTQYEKAFMKSSGAQEAGLLMIYELLTTKGYQIDEKEIDRNLNAVKEISVTKSKRTLSGEDDKKDRIARTAALLRVGLRLLRGTGGGAQGMVGGGGAPGAEHGPMFNTLEYTDMIKRIIKLQLREAASLGPEDVGELTFQEARRRANRMFASMLFGGDRSDMQFVYEMKLGDKTIQTLLGDWLRELPEAEDHVKKAYEAMTRQMSTDSKRAEEITASGIKDTDLLRMMALKFPFAVRYAEKPNDPESKWKSKVIEASAWGAVDYMYGMKKAERGTGKVVNIRSESGNVVRTIFVEDENKIVVVPGQTLDVVGVYKDCPIWTVEKSFLSSNGSVFEGGQSVPYEALTEEDYQAINRGDLVAYPKLDVDVFASGCKVPGADQLTKRAEEIAHAGNWGYFVDLLAKNGISVDQIKDFGNPFEEIGIDIGLAGDLGSDWLEHLKDWKINPKRGKILVIRNLCAGLAPVFSAGKQLAQIMGHEAWWNASYDNSRVMRIMENTIMADAYDNKKGITPHGFREAWLTKTYGDFTSRMFLRAHPIVRAWEGKGYPMNDRVDPWEDGFDYPMEVSLAPINKDMIAPVNGVDLNDLAIMERKEKHGVSIDRGVYDGLAEIRKNREEKLGQAMLVDEHIFGEQVFEPGDWEERKVLNYVVMNCRRRVLEGEPVSTVLDWASNYLDEQQNGVLLSENARKQDFWVTRNSSGAVAAAAGLSTEKKQAIKDRPLYETIYGAAESVEEKARYERLNRDKPSIFKGISGAMLFASEELSLKTFNYGETEREFEAWLRYLCYNADVYRAAKQLVEAAVQTQIDPDKLHDVFMKLITPEDVKGGFSQRLARFLLEKAEEGGILEVIMRDVEANELFKALQAFPEFLKAHADLNWEQKNKLYMAFGYILEGQLDSGIEYSLRSKEAVKDGRKPRPGDKYLPIVLNPDEKTYLPQERELDLGLCKLFQMKGWRVDFNSARSGGVVLLNGGGEAHFMDVYQNNSEWRTLNYHRVSDEAVRPVDVFGMSRFGAHIVGLQLMKLGTNAELVLQDQVVEYQKNAVAWFNERDYNSELARR